ncbi:SDR family oxidoreductase [Chitinophaga pendula]|uniref:SDR family NAD(P)-dependent oxidoreductase n=1 Tax=Chitinophaga TaxID=79328 RepID=UPI000BB020C4|nr:MULTISPECIES: SDR family oxidoreductase [Chitinophaga]ASZ11840.1 oxidoreductase [Chitinophaga sp. MD30]UCJ05133.1 SDR family oxidoreductase [Chitinophaga pendula]
MQQIVNKVAFVSGGSRGIGASIVRKLSAMGAKVVFTYANSADKAEALIRSLAPGAEALAVQADNTKEGAITQAMEQALEKYGQIDILVNNAGVYIGDDITAHTMADYRKVMAVNVDAVVASVLFAAKHLTDGGRIITIGSNMADRVVMQRGTFYAMSKSALIGLTKGLARDLGSRSITVNLVQPGPTDTDMNPADGVHAEGMRQMMAIPVFGDPNDIAALVGFLASDEGKFMTGTAITADGGFNA